MLKLPPKDHSVREHVDVSFLASLAEQENRQKLPSFMQARAIATNILNEDSAITSVNMYVFRPEPNAAGDKNTLRLISFAPKNNHKCLWFFGELTF